MEKCDKNLKAINGKRAPKKSKMRKIYMKVKWITSKRKSEEILYADYAGRRVPSMSIMWQIMNKSVIGKKLKKKVTKSESGKK